MVSEGLPLCGGEASTVLEGEASAGILTGRLTTAGTVGSTGGEMEDDIARSVADGGWEC